MGWTDLTSVNLDGGFDSGGSWVQRQASLGVLAGQTVRLRFLAGADYAGRIYSLALDHVTIGESPMAASPAGPA